MHRAPPRHPATDAHARLVAALRAQLARRARNRPVRLIETHISSVLLAGRTAYKLKKPVDLGFLDFTSLAARHRYCEDECRLNRRTAPTLYRGVVAIRGTPDSPRLGGRGPVIDYAVVMRRFAPAQTLDRRLRAGTLTRAQVDTLAERVAQFHARAAHAPAGRGTVRDVIDAALDNFAHMERLGVPAALRPAFRSLRHWTRTQCRRLRQVLLARRRNGFVRECHGDLHLGNVALVDGEPLPFDAIEFNASFRWIDVMSDAAFAVMDLDEHGAHALAGRFLNRYLEHTGDYAGVAVLRFYVVYRAMVRAKVALIRACQLAPGMTRSAHADLARNLGLAVRHSAAGAPWLIMVAGLSGSGKTTVAQTLLEDLGAVRVRSDVERKRLHGLAPLARSGSATGTGLYTPKANRATYARLAALARGLLQTGATVIVDATFLHLRDRQRFARLARDLRARCSLVWCEAPESVLAARIGSRRRRARDASEATRPVLDHQRARLEPLTPAERRLALVCDTSRPAPLRRLRRRLGQPR